MLVLCLNSWTKVPVSSIQNTLLRRSTGTSEKAIWQPKTGIKWQIQLENAVEDIAIADIFDIDMFDNTAAKISEIHKQDAKVICYFSAGTYEDWRPDANKFTDSDFGNALEDWPGERWLNLHSSNVRKIMQSRLDLAKQKGCDGVDPDNIDAYGNDNGLDLTEADSIDYLNFLASEAHSRGMSIGLKNGGDIIPSVIEKMQWSVNEQCAQYDECDVYAAFTDVGKPVFHIEYADEIEVNNKLKVRAVTSSQKSAACDAKSAENFSTVIKNMELDAWVEYC
jgi:endo-alpha-1,4-polygalactosaminidase (GH114 family)